MTMPLGRPSLRRTLLLNLLLPLVVLVPLVAALLYALALNPALDALDRALTDSAVALGQIVEVKNGRAELPLNEQTARALRADLVDETVFAVGDPRGRLLGGNAELLRATPPVQSGRWHFFEAKLAGKAVRVAAFGRPCGPGSDELCSIVVAETQGKRVTAQRAALLAALVGAAALALPLAALSTLAVRRALRPLQRAVDELRSLTPERLAPIETHGVPSEVVGFVQALNGLLGRLSAAAAAQRAFVANAAHQLRTPLSVVRVEAAEALAQPHADALRPTLERLHAAGERGAHLVQRLLALARAEGYALDPERRSQALDLARLAAEGADRWLPPSLRAGQDLGFELEEALVDGHAMLLEELLDNLVDNAIAHAGRGANVTVRTKTSAGGAVLEVEDDGCGVDADERDLLWQRFRRGRTPQGAGSGLGLAIVADVARLHGAAAELLPGDVGRGLLVRVRFRRADGGATSPPVAALPQESWDRANAGKRRSPARPRRGRSRPPACR